MTRLSKYQIKGPPKSTVRNNIRNTILDAFREYDNIHDIPYVKFTEVCKTFNHLAVKSVIDTGKDFAIPGGIGRIGIRKFKPKPGRKYIDFNETKKQGKTIFHDNKHSEGMVGEFVWVKERSTSTIPRKNAIKFVAPKYYRKELSKAIKHKNTITKYYEH